MAAQRRVGTFLLCLAFLAAGSNGADDIRHDVEEHSSVDLTCNAESGGGRVLGKSWYRGRVSSGGVGGTQLFGWVTGSTVKKFTNRTDMSVVDTDSFTMQIADVNLEDEDTFTCKITTGSEQSGYNVLSVYVLPKVNLQGLEKSFYKENETVTVTCDIPRVKPKPLASDSVTFTWGSEDINMKESMNEDDTTRYNGTHTRKLSRTDDGRSVSCSITMEKGAPVQKEKLLEVHYGPSGVPKIKAKKEDYYLQDTVTLECDKSSINGGNPSINKFVWYKNETKWKETAGKTYSFKVQGADDVGNYSCAMANYISETAKSEPTPIRVHLIVDPSAGTSTAAIAGGVAAAVLVVLILAVVVVYVCKKRASGKKGRPGHQEITNLEHVVGPPPENGEAQYEVIDKRPKPVPVKRTVKKPQEPLYSEATTQEQGPVYSEIGKRENQYANVGNVDRNQNQNPGVVYADVMLSNGPQQPGSDWVRPPQSQPNEYAKIDFNRKPQ